MFDLFDASEIRRGSARLLDLHLWCTGSPTRAVAPIGLHGKLNGTISTLRILPRSSTILFGPLVRVD